MQNDLFQQLSRSSKDALEWANTRARYNNQMVQKSLSNVMICPVDILVGIFLAHQQSSEPDQLIDHFKIARPKFYDMLRAIGGFTPDEAASITVESLAAMPPLDSEAQNVLEKSLELSDKYNPEQPRLIRLRDIFGGILLTTNEAQRLLQQMLMEYSISYDEVANSYPEFLSFPSQEKEYQQFLNDRFPSLPSGKRSIRFAVSGFDADSAKGQDDYIGIGAEVDAFAYLISARELKPPLAIGLFGDWGSGKSFFMEALRNRIHKITEDAQQSHTPQRDISINKYIAQIEFNAWHYVEGELWASLVEHIFRNLKTRSEDEPTLLQQRQQLVIERLELARRAKQAAQAYMAELENQLTDIRTRISTLETERADALKKLNDLKARDILKAVQLSKEEKDKIDQTLKELGITKTYDSATELMHSVDELRDVLQRGNALTTPLRERGWKWAAALIFVILIGPAISLALTRIGDIPSATNVVASVSAFLSGLTIVLKQGTSWLSKKLEKVENARLQLDTERGKVEEQYANEIAEAERQYSEKAAENNQAKNEEKDKERQIAELELELQRITPGRVLLDFVNERVGSQDYRKHLGIAALIRSDFEQLSQLIADQNKAFVEKDDGTVREEDRHLINRIVLYIDDLDRCPPDRVVQVLQAVHLLLAFPLFVVVVAVDARWLSQSLQSYYKNLLSTYHQQEGLELAGGFARQASPQDYLEKIFQIPYWVRPMPESARIRVVHGMISGSLHHTLPEVLKDGSKEKTTDQKKIDDTAKKVEIPSVQWPEEQRIRPVKKSITTDLKPPSLDVESIEFKFVENLQSLLGETPRSVKRFVNVYRLVKAVAMNDTRAFVADTPTAPFKLVQFLLAVLTGLPEISRGFFRLLQERQRATAEVEITNEPSSAESSSSLGEVIAALRQVLVRGGIVPVQVNDIITNNVVGTPTVVTEMERATQSHEFMDALDDLNRLDMWVNREGWAGYDAAVFGEWISEVARFSYRQEEV